MTFFNLNGCFRKQDEARRPRGLKTMCLLAILLFQPGAALAQALDWGKWEEPSAGTDKNIPPGSAYPGGGGLCEGMKLVARHAYWRCMVRSGVALWEGTSDAIYTCPDGKGFRRLEKLRYTKIPCGNKDWQITKHLADLYEETWQKKIDDPPEVTNPQTPPTTEAELPPNTGGDTPPSWDGGGPPWAPKEAEKKDEKTDTGKTDTAKTDTGKTDTSKTDTSKTDTNKADTDKKVTGGSTTTPSGGKKANRKEAQKSKTVTRRGRGDDDYGQGGRRGDISPEEATAIGVGVLYGLGGFGGRGHMGGDRGMGGGRMMDR